MSYFTIIRGPLGCGKTTIAKKLTSILQAKYVSIDEVLHENGLDMINDPDAETISVENFIKANEILIPEIQTILASGTPVVFDGNFQHKKALEHLIEHLSYPNYVFTLKAPVELCIDRDSKRERVYGDDAVRAVHSVVSRFDYGVNIDATQSMEAILRDIQLHLPNM